MTVTTHWSDIWLSADDWAEAFGAPDPGTPHNEARDQIWEELLAILTDKHDGDVPADLLRKSLLQNRELHTARNRAWPLIEAASLETHIGEVLTLAVNCSTASLTAADRMDSYMSKSWCAPGSSA